MPEGAEVRRSTDFIKHLEGSHLADVDIIKSGTRILSDCDIDLLRDTTLLRVFNKGKFIFMHFDNGVYLEIHFNMAGSFKFVETPYSILRFNFDSEILYYDDIRKFGHLTTMNQAGFDYRVNDLGIDLMGASDEEILTIARYINGRPRSAIKQVLMDQYIVGGIGNIYATEGLFLARVDPSRYVGSLEFGDIVKILKLTKEFMWKGYELGGMTVSSFTLPNGEKARGKEILNIYDKAVCPNCGGHIWTVPIGGRTSHYCPNCQK